jgi:protein MpaA
MAAGCSPSRMVAGGLLVVAAWSAVACSEQIGSTEPTATGTPVATATSLPSSSSAPPSTAPALSTASSGSSSSTPTSTPTSTVATTVVAATTTTTLPVGGFTCPGAATSTSSIWLARPAADLDGPPPPDGWTREVVGTSVQGRDIVAHVRPVRAPRRTVVVIGGVHGNEPVSPPAVRGMFAGDYPDDVELWLVPAMNPDGSAAGLRCNANGVDLNRNFPWGWSASDGGPAPLSEPEPAAMVALVQRVAPDLVVWVHQPYGYVSSIGATVDALEQAWSAGSGLPVRPDVSQHGGGESWTAFDHGAPSMLIEIDTWDATPQIVAAQRAGLEATIAALG